MAFELPKALTAPALHPPGGSGCDDSDPLNLFRAQGRRKLPDPEFEILGSITAEDLADLEARAVTEPKALAIRHPHHQLAQLIAQGTEQAEISLITGYSPAYISTIKHAPAFKELLAHYAGVDEAEGVDVFRRMKTLGLTAIEVLQERLDNDPDSWTKRELMELEKLNILEPLQKALGNDLGGGKGSAAGVNVQVNFVTAAPDPQGPIIEHESRE